MLSQQEIEAKAMALVKQTLQQVETERTNLAKVMLSKGMTDKDYVIADNLADILQGKTTEYKCSPVLKSTIKQPNED